MNVVKYLMKYIKRKPLGFVPHKDFFVKKFINIEVYIDDDFLYIEVYWCVLYWIECIDLYRVNMGVFVCKLKKI